jgi:hypothetical protein
METDAQTPGANSPEPMPQSRSGEQLPSANSAADKTSPGPPQYISPDPGAEGVKFRHHRRKAAVPNICLSVLLEPEVNVPAGSVVDLVTLEELSRDGTDETKDNGDGGSSGMGGLNLELGATVSLSTGSLAVLSASQSKEHSPQSTAGPADEPGSIKPPNRRLKLKVSRGALAKARRMGNGISASSSFASYDSGSSPEPIHKNTSPHPNGHEEKPRTTHNLTSNITPAANRHREKNNKVPSTIIRKPPAAATTPPDAIFAALSLTNKINIRISDTNLNDINPIPDGRALRRLRKRFPSLEARLAEVERQQPSLAFATMVAGSPSHEGGKTMGVSESNGAQPARQLHRTGRFRGRVARWVRRARRAIGRVGVVGAGRRK